MSLEGLHTLTNSFLSVRLLALREAPPTEDQGSGPFLVVQRAMDPELPAVDPTDFVLTREGAWIPVEAFSGVAWEEGRALAFFPAAADVMTLLEKLPSRPVVARQVPETKVPEAPPSGGDAKVSAGGSEPFYAAVLRAVRG